MKRRDFFGGLIATASPASATASPRKPLAARVEIPPSFPVDSLRREYRNYLFDDFLPFMEKYVIDPEYGGFMIFCDRDGTLLNTRKGAWHEGRGIWVYSFLYNELVRDSRYLETARRSVDFILKTLPGGDDFWPDLLSREGRPIGGPSRTLYGDLYIAAGLAEFGIASGDRSCGELARKILFKCLGVYDRPDYDSIESPPDPVRGPRRQNVPMLILPVTASLLKAGRDPEVEAIAARAVEAVIERHFNPAYGLNNDILNHDYSRPAPGRHGQYVSFLISVQTLWMILDEAERIGDRELLQTAVERIHRHLEVSRDDVYGGHFPVLRHVDDDLWDTSKPLSAQAEALIALMKIVEHTGASWAADRFRELFSFVTGKYVQKKYGMPLWQGAGDRKVAFIKNGSVVDVFHHPRHLLVVLSALERMRRNRNPL
jgi:N-acylglucosamine 2-epimerase